jgi:hypothetical protein
MAFEPRHGRADVATMDLEAPLLEIGVPEVGVAEREPVHRPAARRHETHAMAGHAATRNLDVDAKRGRLGQRDPHLAAQHPGDRQQAGGSDERPPPVDHDRARGRRVETGHGDAYEIASSVRLLIQGGGLDGDGLHGRAAAHRERQRAEPSEERPAVGHHGPKARAAPPAGATASA